MLGVGVPAGGGAKRPLDVHRANYHCHSKSLPLSTWRVIQYARGDVNYSQGQPPPPPPPSGPPSAPAIVAAKTNGMAIASLVLGILWIYWIGSILALVFGYVARSQIQQSGGTEQGAGPATAWIALGWAGVGIRC